MNRHSGLAYLTVMVYPTRVYSGTTGTNFSVQFLSQLEELIKSFLATYTITTGHYDCSTLQIMLRSLNMTVDNLHGISLGRYILIYLRINNLTLCLPLIESLLHHTGANSGHLWTMIGIDNRRNDVSTKGRTNLIKQVIIVLSGLLLIVITDFQLRTVGSQT